ncbi:MAG: YigZ family protein [Rikenellaceae bacterium]|nr:YigZ family protein [Rikenellaceae bacterium]MBR2333242.1 YigZ family protein [Rikenellaceae bacterium]MBR2451643.1 YigZ family protein [Rikenellaceae bacterium]
MENDVYKTIEGAAECIYKQLSSKFLTFAYHVTSEEQIKEHLDELRKKYYDATHHCYAWRLGPRGEHSRANDDGEPSSTAGKPILGQLLSREVTDCLVVVVRYFGGTKLGVSGLIAAYKQSTSDVLDVATIVERTVDTVVDVQYSFVAMNGVMKIVKEMSPKVLSQEFDNLCSMRLAIRQSRAEQLIDKLSKTEGVTVTTK